MANAPINPAPESRKKLEPNVFELERMKKKLRERRRGNPPVTRVAPLNITSFLDMSFCLLMFLILASGGAGAKEGVLASNLTKLGGGSTGSPLEAAKVNTTINLVVSARDDDKFTIEVEILGENFTSFESLYAALAKNRLDPDKGTGRFDDESPVIIRPRGDVPWQGVMSAFNAAIRARYKNVGFAKVDG